jgi:hypothetical protein
LRLGAKPRFQQSSRSVREQFDRVLEVNDLCLRTKGELVRTLELNEFEAYVTGTSVFALKLSV